jgi:signal transduction histidine kinase
MTTSYILTTLVALLILEGVNIAFLAIVSSAILPEETAQALMPLVREQAQVYALEAQTQALDSRLNPQTTFRPNQPGDLAPPQAGSAFAIPYTTSLAGAQGATAPIALVITPDGRVLTSSAPRQVREGVSVATVATLPANSRGLITAALAGRAGSAADSASGSGGSAASLVLVAADPIWSRAGAPIGAVYVQMPALPLHAALFERLYPWSFLGSVFTLGMILLVLPLVGGVFGTLASRGLVRRVNTLVGATRQVAQGAITERVRVNRDDELGQLERRFNQMAEELEHGLRERQALAEENARLAERARISRELHDAISQDLFSLRLLADGLQTPVAQTQAAPVVQRHLETMKQTTARMIRTLRALLLEMRPPELEHLGLVGALEALAAVYRARLGITVATRLAPVTLAPAEEHALLRIAQEALANAARHADATTLAIDLDVHDGGIRARICDDGHGFVPDRANAEGGVEPPEALPGLGLRLMRERVQELGGTLNVESAPEQGTRLTVWIPRAGQESERDHDH